MMTETAPQGVVVLGIMAHDTSTTMEPVFPWLLARTEVVDHWQTAT